MRKNKHYGVSIKFVIIFGGSAAWLLFVRKIVRFCLNSEDTALVALLMRDTGGIHRSLWVSNSESRDFVLAGHASDIYSAFIWHESGGLYEESRFNLWGRVLKELIEAKPGDANLFLVLWY
jgi:hypothetical protein